MEAKVAAATGLPVAGAVSSVTAALRAFAVESLLLMTPFDAASDALIKNHLNGLGFRVFLGPSFENRKPGAGTGLSPDQLFRLVEETFAANPAAQAIYFQGGTMDPLPILQRLEDKLGVTVLASNAAMLWHLLSLLSCKFSVDGHGKLLSSWPPLV